MADISGDPEVQPSRERGMLNVDDVDGSKIDKMETIFMIDTPFIALFTRHSFCL